MPAEYVVNWSGKRIGRGATVLHFDLGDDFTPATAVAGRVRTFFETIKALIPQGVVLTYGSEMPIYSNDGTLQSVASVVTPQQTQGTGDTAFINGAGGCIRWNTGVVLGGKRIVGRTFLVPVVAAATQDGNLKASDIATVGGAATALIATAIADQGPLVIWSRKNAAIAQVTTGQLLSRPSSLRTRNDR